MSPLRSPIKSTLVLARELRLQKFHVGSTKVGEVLKAMGYSLQSNRKTIEGKQHPDRNAQFEIIMRRHQTRSTIMTSNRPLEDWGKLLGDVPSASAILDRFLHHAEIITFQGRSDRLRNRLAEDSHPSSGPVARSKQAIAPTGNRLTKQAAVAATTTDSTATT